MNIILLQALYYAIVMGLTIGLIGTMLKGFLFKYCKVRFSFGRLLLVKVRSPIRDYYEVGRIEDGFLVYGPKKRELRCSIKKNYDAFYRCLSVNWIDIDEETGGVNKTDYSPLEGYDAKKFSDLLVRALTRPMIGDNKEKIIILAIVGALICSAGAVYLSLKNQDLLVQLGRTLAALPGQLKGSIVSSKGL